MKDLTRCNTPKPVSKAMVDLIILMCDTVEMTVDPDGCISVEKLGRHIHLNDGALLEECVKRVASPLENAVVDRASRRSRPNARL